MGRGGKRSGTPGKGYANRTDLNTNRTLPLSAPSGLPYGENKALLNDQRSLPMASGTVPAPTQASESGPPSGSPPPHTAAPVPGSKPFLRPSENPGEPVTSGLPIGPGPGPEALSLNTGASGNLSAMLTQAAAASPSPALAALASQAAALGQ